MPIKKIAKKIKKIQKQQRAVPEEILLGVDYGPTNIGLAFGREGLVSPLRVVSGKNKNVAIKEISELVLQNKITKIIIGLPKTVDNRGTPTSRQVQRFGKLLKIFLKRPVEYVDESYTSVESIDTLLSQNLPQKSRRKVDAVSAALILRNYYQSRS